MLPETNQETLVFETESARESALALLPESPPPGTADVEAWRRQVDEQEAKIEKAEIKPKSVDDAPQAPPVKPPEPKPEAQPQPSPAEADEEIVIKVKRKELPEELQKYKDGEQIVKQFAHARGNINRVSARLEQTEAELETARTQAQKVEALQKQMEELQKASVTASKAVDSQPASQQKSDLKDKISSLNKTIEELAKADDFGADADKIKTTFNGMLGVLNDAVVAVQNTEQRFASYKNDFEGRYNALKTDVETTKNYRVREAKEEEAKAAVRSLMDLQDKHEDLKTSKPMITESGRGSLEASVIEFAEAVHGGKIPRTNTEAFWSTVNRYVNMYNRGDAEMQTVCQKDGIYPANFGISERDIQNYATLVNVDAIQRGERIDPDTGKREVLTDFRGKQVTFPDADSAYKYMVDKLGIPAKMHQKQLIEAEKRGQSSLEASLSKRDVSDNLIGPEGAGTPNNMGQELTEEMAREILGDRIGPNTIDEEKMEVLIRMNNPKGWEMFERMNRANQRLKLPQEPVERDWPQRIQKAQ